MDCRYYIPLKGSGWEFDFKLYQCSLSGKPGKIFHKSGEDSPANWSRKEMDDCVKLKRWAEITKAEVALLM